MLIDSASRNVWDGETNTNKKPQPQPQQTPSSSSSNTIDITSNKENGAEVRNSVPNNAASTYRNTPQDNAATSTQEVPSPVPPPSRTQSAIKKGFLNKPSPAKKTNSTVTTTSNAVTNDSISGKTALNLNTKQQSISTNIPSIEEISTSSVPPSKVETVTNSIPSTTQNNGPPDSTSLNVTENKDTVDGNHTTNSRLTAPKYSMVERGVVGMGDFNGLQPTVTSTRYDPRTHTVCLTKVIEYVMSTILGLQN